MHLGFALTALATLPLALGAPEGSQPGVSTSSDISCDKVASLVHALKADDSSSDFCNALLEGKRTTKTVTKHKTIHPPRSTKTVTKSTITTETTTVVSYTSTSTFISTITSTATCTPSAGPTETKREAVATPTAVLNQPQPSVEAACLCIEKTKPKPKPKPVTVTVTHTSTCPAETVRVTSFSTSTDTVTVINSTYANTTPATNGIVTITSTAIFAASAEPQHTAVSNDSTAVFNQYHNIDFYGNDIGGCGCDPTSGNDACTVAETTFNCTNFVDCQNVCAGVNDATQNATCLGITWATNGFNHTGVCYLKSSVPTHNLTGCGTFRTDITVDSAVLLFNNYTYTDPYPPQVSS